jgi:hypothetical protein
MNMKWNSGLEIAAAELLAMAASLFLSIGAGD